MSSLDPRGGYGFYGDGYGYGYGVSTGSGDGYGHGHGYGVSTGSGDGYGDGYGYGCGYEFGSAIGSTPAGNATVLAPWPVIRVGCQVHTIDHWRRHWRQIAKDHGVDVTEGEVKRLIKAAECVLMGGGK